MERNLLIAAVAAVCALLPCNIDAQGIFSDLKFESPECLIVPKENSCNVRQNTSVNSVKVGAITSHYLAAYKTAYPAQKVGNWNKMDGDWYKVEANYKNVSVEDDWDHLKGWFKGKAGYVSGRAVDVIKPKPFTDDMLFPNRYFTAEDMDAQWTWMLVDNVGKSKMALLWLLGNGENFLALGKRVAPGIFQFKYCYDNLELCEDHENETNLNFDDDETTYGEIRKLLVGRKFYTKSSFEESLDQDILVPNFQVFTDKMLDFIFRDIINKGPNWNVYITPANFPSSDRNKWDL